MNLPHLPDDFPDTTAFTADIREIVRLLDSLGCPKQFQLGIVHAFVLVTFRDCPDPQHAPPGWWLAEFKRLLSQFMAEDGLDPFELLKPENPS